MIIRVHDYIRGNESYELIKLIRNSSSIGLRGSKLMVEQFLSKDLDCIEFECDNTIGPSVLERIESLGFVAGEIHQPKQIVANDDVDRSTTVKFKLRWVDGVYGIARLLPDAPIPGWADGGGFLSIARADDELTILCLQERIPGEVQADRDWVCLRSVGPFAFDESGVVLRLIAPLSEAGLGVFVVCTFDGEHILVAQKDRTQAEALLRAAGHIFL